MEKEEKKDKKMLDLLNNRPYFIQRITSASIKARAEKERIKNVTHKVDLYLKNVSEIERKVGLKVLEDEVKPGIIEKERLNEIVGRLYKVKKVEKKEKIEKDVRKLDILKAKSKLLVKNTDIVLPQIMKQENHKYATDLKDAVAKTIKRGKSAFTRAIRKEIEEIKPLEIEKTKEKKRPSKDDTLSLNFMSSAGEQKPKDVMIEVKDLIKEYGYDLSKLKQFQKNHPEVDISNYIHKAKMNTVKSAKRKKNKVSENTENNQFVFEAEELLGTNCEVPMINEENVNFEENQETKEKYTKSYLWACIYNNDEFMKAHLISSKNDEEIKSKANEKDDHGRKGLFYLIYHGNYDMIKLSLLSGTLLSDCVDKYERNLFHYIALTNTKYSSLIEVIVKCYKLEFKQNFNELYIYVPKAFLTLKETSDTLSEENVNQILEEMCLNQEIKDEVLGNDDKKTVYKSVNSALNQRDLEGKTPLHYACERNNFEVVKKLLFYHADPSIKDNKDNRAVDLANNELIVQFVLNHSRNNEIKSLMNKNDSMSLEQSSFNTKHNNLADLLDIKNLKLLSEDKINSFRSGYESNNYLILSVTSDNLESFKYLLKEKNMSLLIKNSNGWNAFHFIIKHKRIKFLSFLFGFTEEGNKDLYDVCIKKTYSPNDLSKEKGGLNYLGESFVSLDQTTNNNINPICLSIEINQTTIFKVLIALLRKRETLRELNHHLSKSNISANIEFVLNRKYDKYCQTLLHKAVEKKNIEIVKFLYFEFPQTLSLSETDKDLQNVLHYAVNMAKQSNFITFFVKLDFDKCILRTQKDKQGKTPQEYDTSNNYELFFNSIWDVAKSNNLGMAEKLLNSGSYTVDEQSNLYNNTPAHIAAINSSDKVLLLLVKSNANLDIKNHKGLTVKDYCEKNGNKSFRKKANAIFSGEIKEYSDLENFNRQNVSVLNTTMVNLNDKKVKKIIEEINAKAKEKNINFRRIFKTMDEDKNGRLDGHEFELLFTVMDLDVKKDDILLVMSYADKDRNGIIDLDEFLSLFPDHK